MKASEASAIRSSRNLFPEQAAGGAGVGADLKIDELRPRPDRCLTFVFTN